MKVFAANTETKARVKSGSGIAVQCMPRSTPQNPRERAQSLKVSRTRPMCVR